MPFTVAGKRLLAELRVDADLVVEFLAMYSRPHSADCSINEHHQIIDALRTRDAARAIDAMDHHLQAVTERALLSSNSDKQRDIRSILDRYAG